MVSLRPAQPGHGLGVSGCYQHLLAPTPKWFADHYKRLIWLLSNKLDQVFVGCL